jgi:hypothetical protein
MEYYPCGLVRPTIYVRITYVPSEESQVIEVSNLHSPRHLDEQPWTPRRLLLYCGEEVATIIIKCVNADIFTILTRQESGTLATSMTQKIENKKGKQTESSSSKFERVNQNKTYLQNLSTDRLLLLPCVLFPHQDICGLIHLSREHCRRRHLRR